MLDDLVGYSDRHEQGAILACLEMDIVRLVENRRRPEKLAPQRGPVAEKLVDGAPAHACDAGEISQRIHQHACVSSESDIDANDASMELGGVLAALICVCAAFDDAKSRLSLDR